VLGRYLGLDIPENQRPLDICPRTFRQAFSGQLGWTRMALVTIVDTRRDAGDEVRDTLGAFLAYHVVRVNIGVTRRGQRWPDPH
jgi:hypothetical protein